MFTQQEMFERAQRKIEAAKAQFATTKELRRRMEEQQQAEAFAQAQRVVNVKFVIDLVEQERHRRMGTEDERHQQEENIKSSKPKRFDSCTNQSLNNASFGTSNTLTPAILS